MKSIAIVTNVRGAPLGDFLKDNLASVFADHADIYNRYITELETIELLYHLEIDYLDLVPFEQGKAYPDINIAITPAERRFVPQSIGTVIDIGHRCIDISTFIRIINILRISDADVSWRLLKYLDGTVSLDVGVKAQYRELVIKNSELDAIVNLSHEGILLLGEDGWINLCNASFRRMLNRYKELPGE